jgi:hypothetical protein
MSGLQRAVDAAHCGDDVADLSVCEQWDLR